MENQRREKYTEITPEASTEIEAFTISPLPVTR